LREITTEHVEAFFRKRVPEVSGSTANKIRKQMRCSSPGPGRRNGAPRTPPGPPSSTPRNHGAIRILDPEEETALLAACQGEYKAVARASGTSAALRGGKEERGADLEAEEAGSCLAPSLRPHRHGDRPSIREHRWDALGLDRLRKKGIRIPAAEFKTRKEQVIPIGDDVVEVLKELRKGTASVKVLRFPPIPMFGGLSGSRAAELGIEPPIRIHDLRAGFITRHRRAGTDLEVTKELVGPQGCEHHLEVLPRSFGGGQAPGGGTAGRKNSTSATVAKVDGVDQETAAG